MPPPRIDRYLNSGEALQPVIQKAKEISSLSRRCIESLPPALRPHVVGANIRGEVLILLAANPAVAAKLKLLAEPLGDSLMKQGAKVRAVSVRVQPGLGVEFVAPQQKTSRLSPGAIAALRQLSERLGETPAGRALQRLLEPPRDQSTTSKRSPNNSNRNASTAPSDT